MVSKKVIGGIIAVVAIVSVIALIPVFMYGFGVTAIELNTGFQSNTSSSGTTSGIEVQQFGDWTPLSAEKTRIDPYTYFFGQFNQHTSVSGSSAIDFGNVEVHIFLDIDLLTPAGEINKTVEITKQGITTGEISTIVGPNEGAIVSGMYHLWLTLNISISTDLGDIDIYHTFYLEFNVTVN
ncbi:MAG: hypothetical protein EU518_01100 [Promethearchaeota archaeon]|nr:MAG: hypothetical protein EU518_01100 [Candidatus Lokiarchaeota archaeon]